MSLLFLPSLNLKKILSHRQYEVVEHVVFFGTKKEAARSLNMSERTLETHMKSIYTLTGINHITELVLLYVGYSYEIMKDLTDRKRELMSKITLLFFIAQLGWGVNDEIYARRRRTSREQYYYSETYIPYTDGN